MPILHLFLISLIQGITEFLPISSSGHLVLFHRITDSALTPMAELLIDISVHVGTLLAVLLYFHRDIGLMIKGGFDMLFGKISTDGSRLNINLLISSIPVIIAGFALHAIDPAWVRETWIVATTTIIFGALLWFADSKYPQTRTVEQTTAKDALLIGLAQILALIPGTSRSGITMTASRMLGFDRVQAARYSLLLSTIAISGAGTLGGKDLLESGNIVLAQNMMIAIALSFISALIAIALMMKWLKNQSFKIFAIYRILLGLILFAAIGLSFIN
jgi:undecaprenyl-diphosphatase